MGSSGIRVGAWLVGIPAVVEVFRLASAADVRRFGGVTERYDFWSSNGTTYRLAAILAIVLILGQLLVLAIGGLAGRWRFLVAAVGATQVLCALPSAIFDPYRSSPPSFVRDLPLPSPGGRFVAILVIVVSVAGLTTALLAVRGQRATAIATDGPSAAMAPSWHPDPAGSGRQRWWDGTAWTDHVS